MIPLFDLHCDTFSELYKNGFSFDNAPLHISHNKAKEFLPYIQVCAIWSDFRLSDRQAYSQYRNILNYINRRNIKLSTKLDTYSKNTFILSVEDARILQNDINILYQLQNDGIRVLTLNWKGVTCIGGGWNTSTPLTKFGTGVVNYCFENGIAVDLSHSSEAVQHQVIKIAFKNGYSPIFSHSNAFSVCAHPRNITDSVFKEIVHLKGLIGISMCPEHLSLNHPADLSSIISHVEHFISLGGENCVALGCDFDGISTLPIGITSIESLRILYDAFNIEFGKNITQKIFFKNAYRYFFNLLNEKERR